MRAKRRFSTTDKSLPMRNSSKSESSEFDTPTLSRQISVTWSQTLHQILSFSHTKLN